MNFHETYLRGVLGFVGLNDVSFVHTEGLSLGEGTATSAFAQTRSAMDELLAA